MTVKEFIDQVFLNEYKKIVRRGFHYISFALVALGTEFLGACLDPYDFAERGLSEKRFIQAMRELFPQQYQQHCKALYDDLRCGFAHMLRPGRRFALTGRAESKREKTKHLCPFCREPFPDATVLVAEQFYFDFEQACRKVISRIDSGRLAHPKLSKPFLRIT